MHGRDQVVFGQTGQQLSFYPTEGVPTGATLSVYESGKSNDDSAEWTASVTVDTVSLTLSAASGYSQTLRRRLNLVSTTLTVGKWYWLANPTTGQSELVKVVAKGSGYADVENPLSYDYDTASTLEGIELTATVDATWVVTESKINASDSPWRCKWTYTAGGVARVHWTQLELVRFVQHDDLTDDDLADYWADIEKTVDLPTRVRARRAARVRFETDVRARGMDPATLAPSDELREALVCSCFVILAEQGKGPAGIAIERRLSQVTGNYMRALDSLLPVMTRMNARGEGETTTEPEPLGFFS